MPAAVIQFNGTTGSVQNLAIGTSVALSNLSNSGVSTWAWSFLFVPTGSSASIATPTASTASFTPDLEGTYLVQLVVNGGASIGETDAQCGAVLTQELGLRIPAGGETVQFSALYGWAVALNADLSTLEKDQRVNGNKTSGISSGTFGAGSVVYVNGQASLANGDALPQVVAASASAVATCTGVFWALNASTGNGQKINLTRNALVASGVYTSASSFGNPIYWTNAGGLSLTPGSVTVIVGTVVTLASNGLMQLSISPASGASGIATLFQPTTVSSETNVALTALQSGSACDNAGASGAVTFTLPAQGAGSKLVFAFDVLAAQYLKIAMPAGGQLFGFNFAGNVGGYMRSNAEYSSVSLRSIGGNNWTIFSIQGNWTFDS